MAAVTVFVDDAVRGRFPNICAYDGEPADRRVPVDQQVGGMNPAWLLLVFLGPLGWIVLFFMVFSGGSETLHCLVPVCEHTTRRWKERRRDRWVTGAVLAASLVLTALADWPRLGWYLVAACAVAFGIACFRATMGGIGVHLDASRRWVTFTGVHEHFAAAVRQQQAFEER